MSEKQVLFDTGFIVRTPGALLALMEAPLKAEPGITAVDVLKRLEDAAPAGTFTASRLRTVRNRLGIPSQCAEARSGRVQCADGTHAAPGT